MKKLAVIGASILQEPLIEKAKRMGLETHVFAWAAGDVGERCADFFYPISIVEKEKILGVCREIGIDGICSISSDLATPTVCYVADAMGLTGNSTECAYLSTNKAAMRRAFAACGDPSPAFLPIGKEADVTSPAFLEAVEALNYPLIVKPVDRSGSRGVTLVTDAAELIGAVENARRQSFSGDVIAESFAAGREYSVEGLSCRGEHAILQITEKQTTGAPHFIEIGHREPAELSPDVRAKAEAVVLHALDSLKIRNGASHSEIRIDGGGNVCLIEIGSRMGGDFIGSHLVPATCGFDYVRAVIEIALGQTVRPEVTDTGKKASVRYIISEEDLREYRRVMEEDPESVILSDVRTEIAGEVTDSSTRPGYWLRVQ